MMNEKGMLGSILSYAKPCKGKLILFCSLRADFGSRWNCSFCGGLSYYYHVFDESATTEEILFGVDLYCGIYSEGFVSLQSRQHYLIFLHIPYWSLCENE